jgi:hypothetical protein
MESLYVQGRELEAKDLEWIRQLIAAHPSWNRTKLSEHIAQNWQWRNHAGQLKDMACRTMLLKLEQKGLICLPARQRPSNNHCACRPVALPIAQPVAEPIESQLNVLEPLCIVPAQSREELALFDWLLWRYHYLPYSNGAVGENIKYLVFDCRARPLACLLYGAAAWKLSVRDQFIGWTKQQREANLGYLANNLRFLILPWVRVKNLASRFRCSPGIGNLNMVTRSIWPRHLSSVSASAGPAIGRPTGAGWVKPRVAAVTTALAY